MKFKFLFTFSLILLGVIFILSNKINAATSSSVLVDVLPPNPAPFENVTIHLNSYANNLDSVMITWYLNGQNTLSGIGKKAFSFKAPGAGAEATVVARLAFPEGLLEKRIVVRPNVMVLLWQANDSYVPPFYKGKAMVSPDSEVKVVAMPEFRNSGGASISPKNLTYDWKKDYTNNQEGSGYGKNYFLYTNDYLENSNNISVLASTVDGQNSSQASTTVGAVQPKIIFYKNDNNIGTIWEQSLFSPHRIEGSEVVVAIPYFISPKNLQSPNLLFNWSINNSAVGILGFRRNIMPLKTQEGVSGISKLRLEIENKNRLYQNSSKEMNIEF